MNDFYTDILWVRSPSGVYQSQGTGIYVLYPHGDHTYSIAVFGTRQNVIATLDDAKQWCERHHAAQEGKQ